MHKSALLFYSNPQEIQACKDLNLDSVFTGFENLAKIAEIRQELPNVKLYMLIEVFAKCSYLDKFDDAVVVESQGLKDANLDNSLCPTHPGVRAELLVHVQKCIDAGVDGIWLDALNYGGHSWVKADPLLDVCYCDRCLRKFESYIGEKLAVSNDTLEEIALLIDGSYYIEWLEFKCAQITTLVQEIKKLILASGKSIKLGFYVIPWIDSDYGQGSKRLMGQNLMELLPLVDMYSPMVYHKMVGKDVSWIKKMVEYYWEYKAPFLPYIQTENSPSAIAPDELKAALEAATSAPSQGVCVFFINDLVKQPEKFAVVQDFFSTK